MDQMKDDWFDFSQEVLQKKLMAPIAAMANQIKATQTYCSGFTRYVNQLLIPYLISTQYFSNIEKHRLVTESPIDSFRSYMELLEFNLDISNKYLTASMKALNDYSSKEIQDSFTALLNTFLGLEGEDIADFLARQAEVVDLVTHYYPQAIRDIEPEFGFHFEQPERNTKVAETDRFLLYQVLPVKKDSSVNDACKPILIIPPYVLGANILSFLPFEDKSYAHCFANLGVPTYIRIMKDIAKTPALQVMTGEDDALDTRYFCEIIKKKHGKPVTLNGYCQGGFNAICDYLSGELDGLVDALLTCVSPMDGTRSDGLAKFLNNLPRRFNDLAYGTKTLPNGNKVADGKLMGWVYKLKSIEFESPVVAFLRDMKMFKPVNGGTPRISKTAAAINYWLDFERVDLPLGITRMSFDSYNIPVTKDGTLPVKLFGRELNFKRIQEKKIPWLICYGEKDDLVEVQTALAPLDYIDVETSAFPKGHVAIATSWSNPRSACALHTVFGEKKYRGPVRYQLDLDEALSKSEKKKARTSKTSSESNEESAGDEAAKE